jgi:purine-nucleoside phosphorylase
MLETIKQTAAWLKAETGTSPEAAVILGTGIGGMARTIKASHTIDYSSIPNFPVTTVDGHKGRLIFGTIENKSVVLMQGRFHYYEGYSMQQIIFPVRVLKFLGVRYLFLSNACGALNPDFETGDLMIIEDHINMMPNPLVGNHEPAFGERFPDMSEAYDRSLVRLAGKIARENMIAVKRGCYVGVTGPTFETPSEYKYYRGMGADVIGMSTIPEVIAARQMEMQCFAVSVITDLGIPGKISRTDHKEVLKAAELAEPQLTTLFTRMLAAL